MFTTISRLPIVLSPIALLTAFALLIAFCLYRNRRNRRRTPKLPGPPSKGFLFGATRDIFTAPDLGVLYANWENKYGPVYEIPSSIGSSMLVLGDPKGIAYLCANDTTTYQQLRFSKVFEQRFVRFYFSPIWSLVVLYSQAVLIVWQYIDGPRRRNTQEVCVLFCVILQPSLSSSHG